VRAAARYHARMRVMTLNVNGIRSAARKGLFPWLASRRVDVICLQEIRADAELLMGGDFEIPGFVSHFYPAVRKGYAGVALYSRSKPARVVRGFGVSEFDSEGRYLEAQFHDCAIVSLYLPSGSSGPDRQASKFRFLEAFMPHLATLKRRRKPTILCGDWNIAHKPIDLRNWKSNQKKSGFLPEERAWLDRLYDEHGYVDAFRTVNVEADQYTWWSNRGQAWTKNVGWRIDYQLVSPQLAGAARSAEIFKDLRFSDHAPLTMEYVL
jgi:exodeoxyribonuclease-3